MCKSKKSLVLSIILTLFLTASGCQEKSGSASEAELNESYDVTEETAATFETAEKIDFFKQGKWISSKGIYYFSGDSKGFLEHRDAPDTSTAFSYELDKNGTAVFHMDKTGSSLSASVDFKKPGVIDIVWENGDMETLNFDTEEIPDNITAE